MTTHTTKAKRIAYLEALAIKQGKMLQAMSIVLKDHIDPASLKKIKGLIDASNMIPNAQKERGLIKSRKRESSNQ